MPFLYPYSPLTPYGGLLPPANGMVTGHGPLSPPPSQPVWRNNNAWTEPGMSLGMRPTTNFPVMCPNLPGPTNGAPQNRPDSGQADNSSKGSNASSLKLAGWQMLKIAAAVFTMRAGFHLVPKGLTLLLNASEKRLKIETDNRLLQVIVGRIQGINGFLTNSARQQPGSSLYKSLMAIVDGLMMLYVGNQVDRYFCKKNGNFKPKEVKDPEKVVDKVLLVLIATERMEALMHHFFHWLDPKAKSSRQFLYGELAALSAVLLDTTVKIASDRYRLKKNAEISGEKPGAASPAHFG